MPAGAGGASYHHGDLAGAALAAAYAQVAETGAEGLSLRGVATAAGVTHRALYRHYADREALLSAVAARGYEALAAALGQAVEPRAFITAYAGFALAQPRIYALMMARDRRQIATDGPLKAAAFRVIALSERILAQDARPGAPRRDRIVALWSLLHGAITLYRAGLLRAGSERQFTAYLLHLAGEAG